MVEGAIGQAGRAANGAPVAPLLWWSALIAGTSYWAVPLLLGLVDPHMLAPITTLTIIWKGLGVSLLALWALINARSTDGMLITGVMAFGALGDVLLDAAGLSVGAVAFVIGHLLAITLYLRNRRQRLSSSQRLLAILTVPLALVIAWAETRGAPGAWQAIVYTLIVALMAACAWISRFPRYRVGLGAMLFLASDLIIFAREGEVIPVAAGALLIWPLYFAGQALIANGVVTTLAREETGS